MPQGHPVVIQAGDSDEGREFAASAADVIFTRHGTMEAGRAFYAASSSASPTTAAARTTSR